MVTIASSGFGVHFSKIIASRGARVVVATGCSGGRDKGGGRGHYGCGHRKYKSTFALQARHHTRDLLTRLPFNSQFSPSDQPNQLKSNWWGLPVTYL